MKKIIVILILATFILLAQPVLAADLGPILPPCAANGRCSLCDLIQVGVNFGEFLFAISGALLLLFIFYGGFLMLVSGGNPQTVGKGKSAMVNAVIGILIVFTAYMGVNTIIKAVTNNTWSWSGNLQCKPLPESVGWTAGIIGQGAGGGSTTTPTPASPFVPIPSAPTPTVNCTVDITLACDKNQTCGACGYCGLSDKLCKNKKDVNDSCETGEIIDSVSNSVCKSNICVGATATPYVKGKCVEKPPTSTTPIIQNCTSTGTICSDGYYCRTQTGDACVPQRNLGEPCAAGAVYPGGDNAALNGKQCVTGWCDTYASKCVKGAGQAAVGEFCTKSEQCSTNLCISANTTALSGVCYTKKSFAAGKSCIYSDYKLQVLPRPNTLDSLGGTDILCINSCNAGICD